MKWNSKITQDPPSLPYPPYHPVQSTLALPVKENRRLNQISKSIQVYVKLPNVNLPKIFSIHNDYEHPENKSCKNLIRHKIPHKGVSMIKKEDTPS
ncbi:hypothetical protein NPIL_327421 [Nephila pilipes]|uniref:Uncharacterized protein n=1 Tax=Nephila pilipes TaxID=299642 RepID=A0A8X6NH69_NEPPI|nr:hypothetical protein NPIL_647941 [Nephila pilipes]GFT12984.1 hypothetical protein NPIL_327421 [Nephila pilipes]